VVVNALNPPYTNAAWGAQVLPMTESAVDVSRGLAATLMVPGNVYNFGAGMPELLTESTPQQAQTVKGKLRVEMEELLHQSGVRSVVIRAGDFFGSGKGTWFDTTVVAKLRQGVLTYPGPSDVATPWAYLPDLARTFVAVAVKRAHLQTFEVLHFAGHRLSARQWMDALTPVARSQAWIEPQGQLRLSALPWHIIRIGALFKPTWDALLEMRYLWHTPHALHNVKLTALIGPEPHTPLVDAARAALEDLHFLSSLQSETCNQPVGLMEQE
jgi:nucleoside-diphosphate-sugar epimerase